MLCIVLLNHSPSHPHTHPTLSLSVVHRVTRSIFFFFCARRPTMALCGASFTLHRSVLPTIWLLTVTRWQSRQSSALIACNAPRRDKMVFRVRLRVRLAIHYIFFFFCVCYVCSMHCILAVCVQVTRHRMIAHCNDNMLVKPSCVPNGR